MQDTPSGEPLARRHHPVALAIILLIAAAVRFYWNDVEEYSPADESHYLRDARALAAGGPSAYPSVVDGFLLDQTRWVFPNPLRWGYLGAASLFFRLTGSDTFRALATLSTLAGLLSVLLTYLAGIELLDRASALISAGLMATSPLQLAMGRRALADELFCAAFLLMLFALLRHLRATQPRERLAWLLAWIVATTFTIAVKEQFLIIYPVIIFFWWIRSRRLSARDLVTWALPPILFASIFFLLAGSIAKFFRVAWIITSEMTAPYAAQYQAGAPHRIVIDFLAIAPIVTMLAIFAGGFVLLRDKHEDGQWHLFLLLAGILGAHALLPSKNLRYLIEADALTRLLVAALISRELCARGLGWLTASAVLVINGAIELMLFVTVFVRADVYDPVTDSVLRALNMLPR